MSHPTPDLTGLHLEVGKHKSPDDGLCLLEAVAFIAGEPHTDHPRCVSPVLGEFGRRLSDVLPDDLRQRLIPLMPRMVGTANDGLDETRGWLAVDWLVRVHAPAWLDLAGLSSEATALRGLAPIKEAASARAAKAVAARDAAAAAAAAAGAAGVAAWAAARDAAWVAAVAAARDAAAVAARDAAAVAAVVAAAVAAWDAAWVALAPTVTALRLSAIDLLDRMIDGRWAA